MRGGQAKDAAKETGSEVESSVQVDTRKWSLTSREKYLNGKVLTLSLRTVLYVQTLRSETKLELLRRENVETTRRFRLERYKLRKETI